MSSIPCPSLPADTAQAAELIFGRDHPYLQMGKNLEAVWTSLPLAQVGEADSYLAASFHPYSLATILQFWEHLTDRQMSQATRTRLDMKYALHLPLSFPGIEPETLCEFRQHALVSPPALEILSRMLTALSIFGKQDGSNRGAEEVVASICLPSRAEIILDSMNLAIEAVAAMDPNWLKEHMQPHWYRRYHLKIGHRSLPASPGEVEKLIESVGNDGRHLLRQVRATGAASLAQLPEIRRLDWEWQRQFVLEESSLKFRERHCLACSRELQVIKNTLKRKETGQLKQSNLNLPAGGKGRAPEK